MRSLCGLKERLSTGLTACRKPLFFMRWKNLLIEQLCFLVRITAIAKVIISAASGAAQKVTNRLPANIIRPGLFMHHFLPSGAGAYLQQ